MKDSMSEKVICSDLIFRQLSNFIPELKHAVLHDEKGLLGDLDFHINGFLSPRDFQRIAQVHSPEYFTFVPIYSEEEYAVFKGIPSEEEKEDRSEGSFFSKDNPVLELV